MSPNLVRLGVVLATAAPLIAAGSGADAVASAPHSSDDPAAHSHSTADGAHSDTVPVLSPAPTTTDARSTTDDATEATTGGPDHSDMSAEEHAGMTGMHDGDVGMDGGGADHSDALDEDAADDVGSTDPEHGHEESGTVPAGDDHGTSGPAAERPRAAVLGAFLLVNGAVLVAAAVLRRRDRARPRRRPRASTVPAST